jgi:uncharacterized protein (TIGR02646 family)
MRKVSKDFSKPPAELITCAQKYESQLIENKTINEKCYKKAGKHLEKLYNKKCAYCEQKYLASSDTWVEHYRPKSKENYYWLAYEWSNLIPTCTKCNRSKNKRFPLINDSDKITEPPIIRGKLDAMRCRADHEYLFNEKPFVLHPEIDNPSYYLDFELDNDKKGVKISGKDIEGRGTKTIEVCDLNREDLKLDRQEKVIDNLIENIDFLFLNIGEGAISIEGFYQLFRILYLKLVEKSKNDSIEHTLLRRSILDPVKFEEIVCPFITNAQQKEIVLKVFKNQHINIV